jgi:hypothetical protein
MLRENISAASKLFVQFFFVSVVFKVHYRVWAFRHLAKASDGGALS